MSIVRQLFGLATGKNGETPVELRNAARAATVVVASCNTPLFITTLSFDILNATEVEQRNATLKLLGFMVRKVRFSRMHAEWNGGLMKRDVETFGALYEFTEIGGSGR